MKDRITRKSPQKHLSFSGRYWLIGNARFIFWKRGKHHKRDKIVGCSISFESPASGMMVSGCLRGLNLNPQILKKWSVEVMIHSGLWDVELVT